MHAMQMAFLELAYPIKKKGKKCNEFMKNAKSAKATRKVFACFRAARENWQTFFAPAGN
jgi:hypothetical protein